MSDNDDANNRSLSTTPRATRRLADKGTRTSPTLNDVFETPVAEGLYFNGKDVYLDGYKFVGCRFDRCSIYVHGTNFELIDCVIDPSTRIHYGEGPMKAVRFFNSRFPAFDKHWPEFTAIRNPDGSITVDGKSR